MLKPLIPPQLTFLALGLGAGLFGAGQYLPGHWASAAATLGSVALFLGGLGWRAPAWAAGKPLLPMTLLPFALSGHALLERFAPMLPAEWQGYATLALGLLALLAGKVTPEPLKVAPGTAAVVPNTDGTVTATVSGECSLAGAAQGCKP